MQYGNYSSSVIAEYLSKYAYDEVLANNKENHVVTISIKSENSYDTYNDVSKYLSSKNIDVLSKNYDEQSKSQRLAIANILVLIILAFSILVFIVSLLVSKFKITESIEEEIKEVCEYDKTIVYGDAVADGVIRANDARLILRYSTRLQRYTEKQRIMCDIDRNGTITAADARITLRLAAKLI